MGAGKTRLAARAAAEPSDRWPHGMGWVDLARIKDGSGVAAQIASSLNVIVEPGGGPLRSLSIHLRDHAGLLCLDNCEHVLDGAAHVVDTLLRTCPRLVLLTTSREPLGVQGEALWPVPPLGAEDAFALFMDRAHLVNPWLTLDASSGAAVRAVCSRLDGIPLALELAAAWIRTLTPQQIEAGLDNRFALLARAPRGAVARQQSLAASIDWSHTLLDDRDRIVFRRLAVFGGTFGLDAARAVCVADPIAPDELLDSIGRLVDKSLILVEQRGAEARYRLLETIRQYAGERLEDAGETSATRDRHLDHFLAFAEAMETERRRDLDAWRVRLEPEYDELRAALEWGLDAPDPARGRRLAATLPWLWHLNSHGREGIDYLERAIQSAPDERSAVQARLLTGVALVVDTTSPLDFEFDAAQRALEIATEQGDDGLGALCLALSAVGQFYTDFDAALSLSIDAATAAEAAGDAFVADAGRSLKGIVLHLRDRHEDAEPLLHSAVQGLLHRHRGIAATALGFQARGAFGTGEVERAIRLAEQAVAVAEPLGDYHRVGSTRSVLALIQGLAGDVDGAFKVMAPVVRLVEGAEHDVFVPEMDRTLGTLPLLGGSPEEAALWFERAARSTDRGTETWLATEALPGLGAALAALDRHEDAEAVLDRAVTLARRFDMPHVLAAAYERQAELVRNGPARALDLHHAALAERVEHGLRTFYADSLEAIAALVARSQPSPDVVRWIAASEQERAAMGYPRDGVRQRTRDLIIAELRVALGDQLFYEAWSAGCHLGLDQAVVHARRSRGTRHRPATGWDSLTPTEVEVVTLAVEGLNNPAIGRELFMSRGTVKTHLSHIYAKLGVANRTELAAIAAGRSAGSSRPREIDS